jgi:acetyltransferase-like isoleucine patch superfamily enzyme
MGADHPRGPEDGFVHPQAMCDSVHVGRGTVVWAYAHVLAGAVIGERCKIGEHSFIEDGARLGDRVTVKNGALIWRGVSIGDDVFIGPRATFTNDERPRVSHPVAAEDLLTTTVADGASLGASVTVLPGVRIGRSAFVGAGSLVTRDVPDHAMVFGVPARQTAWVCACGRRLDDDLACPCGRAYALADHGLVALEHHLA